MKRRAVTVAGLVRALGGTSKVADWLGVTPEAVDRYKERNSIPPGWHLRIYLELQSRGIPFSLRVFGFSESRKAA